MIMQFVVIASGVNLALSLKERSGDTVVSYIIRLPITWKRKEVKLVFSYVFLQHRAGVTILTIFY